MKRHSATITRSSSTSYTSSESSSICPDRGYRDGESRGQDFQRGLCYSQMTVTPNSGLSFLVHLDFFFFFFYLSFFYSSIFLFRFPFVLSLGFLLDVTVSGVDRTHRAKERDKKKRVLWGAASRRQYGSIQQSFKTLWVRANSFSRQKKKKQKTKTGFPISLLTFSKVFFSSRLFFCFFL